MYVISKNNEYPKPIPERIKLSNGQLRTDNNSFTLEEIVDAGYTIVENPPIVTYPNKLEWDSKNLQWVVRLPNSIEVEQRWNKIRIQCDELLSATDYKVTKAIELAYINGTTVDQELDTNYVTYRQELRDLYNNTNDIDPWNVVWPTKPI